VSARANALDAFFVAAPAGLALLDDRLRYVRVNETLAEMNRRPADDHVGKTVRDVAPALASMIEPILQEVLRTGKPVFNIPLAIGPAPSSGAVQRRVASYFPVRTASDGASGVGIIVVDVTEFQRTREALEQALRREQSLGGDLRLLLDSTAEGIFGVDTAGRCTFINTAGAAMLGFAPPELVGREIHPLVHHSRADGSPYPADHCPVHRTIRTGDGCRLDDQVLWRRDGAPFEVEYSSYPIVRNGMIEGGVVTFVDVTARKQAERALRTRVRQEEAVAQLGLLALRDLTVDAVMEKCAVLVAQALDVQYCKIMELLPGGRTLRLRAGVGWTDGLVGRALEPAGLGSHAGYTIRAASPTIADDLWTETRFQRSSLLAAHGIVSGVDVIIHGKEAPFGILGAHTGRRRTFTGDDVNFLQAMANVIAAALERRRAAEGLQVLSRRLLETHEEVQRSIARELHDEVGQALTALKLVLDMARRNPDARLRDGLRDAQELVEDLIGRTRRLSLNLRPAVLDDLGLLPAVRHHLERYTSATGVQVRLEHSGVAGRRFATPVETAAYRIVQEALTNVARHARVGEAAVRLWTAGGALGLAIEDKGAGFDAASAPEPQRSSGLVGMRERAALLGGRLAVESAPGAGTRIVAELPCAGSD
jgi:PAS domain S-box-containing protein